MPQQRTSPPNMRKSPAEIRHLKVAQGPVTPEPAPEEPPISEVSDADDDNPFVPEIISGVPTDAPLIEKPDKTRDPTELKSGPPSIDEWQDFLGRIVVRLVLEGYLALMLRDIEMTEDERASIAMSKQDLKEIAAPLATVAAKNKWTRKHGREILAFADSYEAGARLVIWAHRVERIRRRHRKGTPEVQPRPSRNPLLSRSPRIRHEHQQQETQLAEEAVAQQAQQAPVFIPPVQPIQMPAPKVTLSEEAGQLVNPRMVTPNGSGNGTTIRKPSPPNLQRFGLNNPGTG
jgi:hypothetical protein